MAKKSNLPAVVHDHFRKANKLHTYVQKELGEATKHALEIGAELLAAKKAVPHGSWGNECKRLFDGSPTTAKFYMRFSKDFGKLKTTGQTAVLMLEGTLEGAAKAAKKATAKPSAPKSQPPPPPEPAEPIDVDSEPVDDDDAVLAAYCPNCCVSQPVDDDGDCAVCNEPNIVEQNIIAASRGVITDASSEPVCEPPAAEPTEETPEPPKQNGKTKGNGKPPKQYEGPAVLKQWGHLMGPMVRFVDKLAEGNGNGNGSPKLIQDHLQVATEEMEDWMGVE